MRRINKINKGATFCFLLSLILITLTISLQAKAHYPGIELSAFGTATIDGVMSVGEWDNAASINFLANVPLNDGGGTTPATLFVMNDETNLYLALKIARKSLSVTGISFEFDNDHNGVWPEEGDDAFGMNAYIFSPPYFHDNFRTMLPPCPSGYVCGPFDTDFGGTKDGEADASNDGAFTYIEISHPLNSGDDLHDFNLDPGDTIGFWLDLRLFSLIPNSQNYADTYFPDTNLLGDIEIASPFPGLPDLTISYFPRPIASVTDSLNWEITVHYMVKNQGLGYAGPSRLDFYLSKHRQLNPATDYLLGSVNIPDLKPDDESPSPYETASFTLPKKYRKFLKFIIGIADGGDTVEESNEINNIIINKIAVVR